MPQITCPNCGLTINLENRKEIDFNIIVNAIKKKPRTFTELLYITKLSRKTLSLRLKFLCGKGAIIKNKDVYNLNSDFRLTNIHNNFIKQYSRNIHDKKIRIGLMLITFLLISSTSGYVLATFLMLKEIPQEPVPLGSFTMALYVNDVHDLYAWQVVIRFNSTEIKVLEVRSEASVNDFPVNSTDTRDDLLLLANTLLGSVSGKSGSYKLATIVFGYFVNEYSKPRIVFDEFFPTILINSKGSYIPIQDSTLMLYDVEK